MGYDSDTGSPEICLPQQFQAKAWSLGRRLDIRLDRPRVAFSPPVFAVGTETYAVLFRYGAVVVFGGTAASSAALLDELRSHTREPFRVAETEDIEIAVRPDVREGIEDGVVLLQDANVERLQIVGEILAKSVVLAQEEEAVAEAFDAIEPLASNLEKHGRGGRHARALLQHIGRALRVQQRMVARVEVLEKPELLWERSELERLYLRLEHEYELRERHVALERKITLISDTAETLLDLLQTRRSLRVEWYIVVLIVVEILLTLYQMWGGKSG